MDAGTRFGLFLQRAKWKRHVAKHQVNGLNDFPLFIQEEIRQAWSGCFAFRGEANWDGMVADAAKKITDKHPWLSPFTCELRQAISNY